MSRIATIGMFDGVHCGHRFLLDFVKAHNQTGHRPVAVTFVNHPRGVTSPQSAPDILMEPADKCRMLVAEGFDCLLLDFDINLQKLTAEQFMQHLRDNYGITTLVLGHNNRFGCDHADYPRSREIAARLGMTVLEAPELRGTDEISSSMVRRLITEGRVEEVPELLGYNYFINGKVVNGNHIGRTIGFPTANILPSNPSIIVPRCGVYAADAFTSDGRHYRAVVNIGHRPTIESTHKIHIEAFLIGFQGNIYGENLRLAFLKRLRDEKKFDSLTQLQAQIELDRLAAEKIK